jgi:3-deoxy-7-phosphoheptulonate synthase
MLESFLVAGRQDHSAGELTNGQTITDACKDWDDTVAVIDRLAAAVRARLGE